MSKGKCQDSNDSHHPGYAGEMEEGESEPCHISESQEGKQAWYSHLTTLNFHSFHTNQASEANTQRIISFVLMLSNTIL